MKDTVVPLLCTAELDATKAFYREHLLALAPNGVGLHFGHLLPEKVESAGSAQ